MLNKQKPMIKREYPINETCHRKEKKCSNKQRRGKYVVAQKEKKWMKIGQKIEIDHAYWNSGAPPYIKILKIANKQMCAAQIVEETFLQKLD